ncbi:hypothetical protein L1887_17691 [Cichorium endivia]|nr:hypothetical protein L1887_17691 [Cichorium endivia]
MEEDSSPGDVVPMPDEEPSSLSDSPSSPAATLTNPPSVPEITSPDSVLQRSEGSCPISYCDEGILTELDCNELDAGMTPPIVSNCNVANSTISPLVRWFLIWTMVTNSPPSLLHIPTASLTLLN